MVAISKISCQPLSSNEMHNLKSSTKVAFKGEEENDVFNTNLFEEQDKLEKKIETTNELFETAHEKSVNFLENNKLGKVFKPLVKAGCMALVGALGFFFGKFALANQFVRGTLAQIVHKAGKLVNFDTVEYSNKFFDTIVKKSADLSVLINKKANGAKPKSIKSLVYEFAQKANKSAIKWGKKGVKRSEIIDAVKKAKGDSAGLKEALKRATAQNFILKTLGATVGTTFAIDAAIDAGKADLQDMPDVVKKHAKKAGAAALIG